MKDDKGHEENEGRLRCPHKGFGAGSGSWCWENDCAMWDRKRNQCAYLSQALAKADEVDAARRRQEVMERYNESRPVETMGPLY